MGSYAAAFDRVFLCKNLNCAYSKDIKELYGWLLKNEEGFVKPWMIFM